MSDIRFCHLVSLLFFFLPSFSSYREKVAVLGACLSLARYSL